MLSIIVSQRSFPLILAGVMTFALAVTTAPCISYAQSAGGDAAKAESGGKKGSKRTTINFEDQLIEGRTQKPELFVLLQNRMNNSRRLFKLRENFLPEMRKTAEDVGRAESNVRGSAEPAK